jgi:uncharacterized protein involved in cysteine biosynthesis
VNSIHRSAGQRFWRGAREVWTLVERMRAHPPLWKRYQRIVVAQILATLLAGGVVFWVGKHGSDVWRDAFGPDEPEVAPVTAGPTAGALGPAAPGPQSPVAPMPAPPDTTASGDSAAASGGSGAVPQPGRSRPAVTAPRGSTEDDEAEDEDASNDDESEGRDGETETLRSAARLSAAAIARAAREVALEARQKRSGASGKAEEEDPAAAHREQVQKQKEELHEEVEALALGARELAREPPGFTQARLARRNLERTLRDVERRSSKLEAEGALGLLPRDRTRLETIRADLRSARNHERGLAGRFGSLLALLAAIYASLSIAQIAVLAVSRDFHDAVSRELSLLINVAPEDPPLRPRLHLDLPWVRRKANRRMRFFLAFIPGTLVISALCWFLPMRRTVTSILTALWAAYWWMVMTAGQSARAWSPPETTPAPWYLRGWNRLIDKVFLLRWGAPRAWGRLWHRFSKRFHGPSERVEEQPLEFAGLALARTLALVPILKLAVRPLFSVAAAHLLVEHAATARLPVAVTPRELELAAARAPDPEARTHSGVLPESTHPNAPGPQGTPSPRSG